MGVGPRGNRGDTIEEMLQGPRLLGPSVVNQSQWTAREGRRGLTERGGGKREKVETSERPGFCGLLQAKYSGSYFNLAQCYGSQGRVDTPKATWHIIVFTGPPAVKDTAASGR